VDRVERLVVLPMPRHEFSHQFARLGNVSCRRGLVTGLADLGKQFFDFLRARWWYGLQRLGAGEQAFGPGTV